MYICNYFAEIDFRKDAADVLENLPRFQPDLGSPGRMVARHVENAFLYLLAPCMFGGLLSDNGAPVDYNLVLRLVQIDVETVQDLVHENASDHRILGGERLVAVLLPTFCQL